MNKSEITIEISEENRNLEVSCSYSGSNKEMQALADFISNQLPHPVYAAVKEFFTKKKESKNVSVH